MCLRSPQLIDDCIKQYALLPVVDQWEILKANIAQFSRNFSKKIAQSERQNEFQLYQLKSLLQEDAIKYPDNIDVVDQLRSIDTELDSIAEIKTKKIAFRCKAHWLREGEKNSKYFFGLEKRNYSAKTMHRARLDNGTITENNVEILNVQSKFYSSLYTSDKSVKFTLNNESGVCLDSDEAESLEESISIDEVYDAIMTLKKNKTPGCDGITIEFYQHFWHKIKKILFELMLYYENHSLMNESARRGVINLIPKKGRDNTLVKNWRPITLLNYDYKIFAKIISNRLGTVIDQIIGPQQSGFIKGRSIQNNLRKTLEVVIKCKNTNTPGVVALLDWEKCFDRVEYVAIAKTMHYFGFHEKIHKNGKHPVQSVFLLCVK